jgi:hypothetical protein
MEIDTPPGDFNEDFHHSVKKENINFLSFSNANIKMVKKLDILLGFHVIRDPRDIVVSAYFSHLHSHPTTGWPLLAEHKEKLEGSSKEEGLFLEIDFCMKEFEDLYNWDYNQPNVLEIKMEDIMISPYETMIDVFSHLKLVDESGSLKYRLLHSYSYALYRLHKKSKGILPFIYYREQIPVDVLLGYIYQNRFKQKTQGRKHGEEDVKSHYRKGVAGDWINHLNEKHRKYFKKHYGDLLIKLGYEKTSAW